MIVKYKRTLKDLVEFNLFHIAHSPSLQRQILFWRAFLGLLTILLLLGIIYFLDSDGYVPPFAYIISIIAGTVVFFIYPPINRASMIHKTHKLLSEGNNESILGPQIVSVSSKGLHCKTGIGESTLNWSSIVKVAQNDDYIFVYISAMNAIIIPKEAFSTNETEQEFLNLINTNCELV